MDRGIAWGKSKSDLDATGMVGHNELTLIDSLAHAEMRLILAKVLFTFDLELEDKTQEWMKLQKVFTLWNKPSLFVKIRPVKR